VALIKIILEYVLNPLYEETEKSIHGVGRMIQVVECPPNKHMVLSSNPSTGKKKVSVHVEIPNDVRYL
jgi:hypothetical protein